MTKNFFETDQFSSVQGKGTRAIEKKDIKLIKYKDAPEGKANSMTDDGSGATFSDRDRLASECKDDFCRDKNCPKNKSNSTLAQGRMVSAQV